MTKDNSAELAETMLMVAAADALHASLTMGVRNYDPRREVFAVDSETGSDRAFNIMFRGQEFTVFVAKPDLVENMKEATDKVNQLIEQITKLQQSTEKVRKLEVAARQLLTIWEQGAFDSLDDLEEPFNKLEEACRG